MAQDEPGGKCGAKRVDGTPCLRGAGYGTDHPGWGTCKYHFGSTPAVRRGAERNRIGWMARKAAEALSLEVVTTPEDALNAELQRSFHMVAWIDEQLKNWPIDDDGNVEVRTTVDGIPAVHTLPAVVALATNPELLAVREMFLTERKHLSAVAKWGVDSNLIERKIALDERKLDVMSDFIAKVVVDLGLDPNDNKVRRVVSTRLRELASA